MAQHQLPLSQTPEGLALLLQHYPQAELWQRGLCLQGYLFYPYAPCSSAVYSHPDHPPRHWVYAQDFLAQKESALGERWQPLARELWLAPARVDRPADIISSSALFALVKSQCLDAKRPLLLAALREMNGTWLETYRLFVMPAHWPHQTNSV